MSSYATLTDATTFGLVPSAYGLDITEAQIQANLDAASDECDTLALASRYSLPILPPYPMRLVQSVVHRARYNILAIRGFDENNASDRNILTANAAVEKLWHDVARQAAHFAVRESPAPTSLADPQYADPLVVSLPLQGWNPNQGPGGGCPPGVF